MPPTPLISVPSTPQIPDPLPLYTRRDPDAVSIRSSAPSYVSEAPTYHSSIPPLQRSITTNPTPLYAPGFRRAYTNTVGDVANHRFNIAEWSSVTSGHQARLYQAVAHRRATVADIEEKALIHALANSLTSPTLLLPTPLSGPSSPAPTSTDIERFPHEDPDLVGPAAAQQARERRLYLEKHESEQAALRQENKSWDFMLGQMADWRERERSWEKFRKEVGKTRLLGRRLRV